MESPWNKYRRIKNNPMTNEVKMEAVRDSEAGLFLTTILAAILGAFIVANLILLFL